MLTTTGGVVRKRGLNFVLFRFTATFIGQSYFWKKYKVKNYDKKFYQFDIHLYLTLESVIYHVIMTNKMVGLDK